MDDKKLKGPNEHEKEDEYSGKMIYPLFSLKMVLSIVSLLSAGVYYLLYVQRHITIIPKYAYFMPIVLALLSIIFLRSSPVDVWVPHLAASRIGSSYCKVGRKTITIDYDLLNSKKDITKFVNEITEKSEDWNYFIKKIQPTTMKIVIEVKEKIKLPRKANFDSTYGENWNYIPMGICLTEKSELGTINWMLNDNEKVTGEHRETIPSVSLLISGGTGSGKSVLENNIIRHCNKFNENIQTMLIDVKRVEFGNLSNLEGIKAVALDIKEAEACLRASREIMYARFKFMERSGVNNIYKLKNYACNYYLFEDISRFEKAYVLQFDEILYAKKGNDVEINTIEVLYNLMKDGPVEIFFNGQKEEPTWVANTREDCLKKIKEGKNCLLVTEIHENEVFSIDISDTVPTPYVVEESESNILDNLYENSGLEVEEDEKETKKSETSDVEETTEETEEETAKGGKKAKAKKKKDKKKNSKVKEAKEKKSKPGKQVTEDIPTVVNQNNFIYFRFNDILCTKEKGNISVEDACKVSKRENLTVIGILNKGDEGKPRRVDIKIKKGKMNAIDCIFKPKAIINVIDEMTEVMETNDYKAQQSISESISSIARLGRAAACHLVLATQRPSAQVISSDLKNNIQMTTLLGGFGSSESTLCFDEDISDICKPEIKGRGFVKTGNDIFEYQSFWIEPKYALKIKVFENYPEKCRISEEELNSVKLSVKEEQSDSPVKKPRPRRRIEEPEDDDDDDIVKMIQEEFDKASGKEITETRKEVAEVRREVPETRRKVTEGRRDAVETRREVADARRDVTETRREVAEARQKPKPRKKLNFSNIESLLDEYQNESESNKTSKDAINFLEDFNNEYLTEEVADEHQEQSEELTSGDASNAMNFLNDFNSSLFDSDDE